MAAGHADLLQMRCTVQEVHLTTSNLMTLVFTCNVTVTAMEAGNVLVKLSETFAKEMSLADAGRVNCLRRNGIQEIQNLKWLKIVSTTNAHATVMEAGNVLAIKQEGYATIVGTALVEEAVLAEEVE